MKFNFISAPKDGALRKQIGMSGIDYSFPKAYLLSSYEFEIEKSEKGLKEYKELLEQNGLMGRALMKGLFKRELICESRAGLIDKDILTTQFIVLDIDGLEYDLPDKPHYTSNDVKRTAEYVINMLPEEFHHVSYVAVASSSFGRKQQASVHLHFFVETQVDNKLLKTFLRSLNFSQPLITEKLKLTSQKYKVKSIIDPCLADPTRIVYLSPPFFGPDATNPFKDDSQRYVLVEKDTPLLSINDLLLKMDANAERYAEIEALTLKRLQKKYGVPQRTRKTKTFTIDSNRYSVTSNPHRTQLRYHSDNDKLVNYNKPGGTSGSYYVFKNNPEIIWSFKPDENPELFSEVDPITYQEHVSKWGKRHDVIEIDNNRVLVRRHMFIDHKSNDYYVLSHDFHEDRLVELTKKKYETAKAYMEYKGELVPEPVPTYYLHFAPTDKRALYERNGDIYVNKFIPSEFQLAEDKHELDGIVGYGQAHSLMFSCPTIYQIIHHMLGDDDESFEHFINWFAAVVVRRIKTETAWVFQGTEGTGKGLFFKRIVKRLIHESHCRFMQLQQLTDDKFNDWLEETLFLCVDEFNVKNASQNVTATANKLKSYITDSTFGKRGMQVSNINSSQYVNLIFFTNDIGSSWNDKRRLNFAPRQNVPLEAKFSHEMREWVDEQIDQELPKFASFLRGFKISDSNIRRLLHNEAKAKEREANLNASERFFQILQSGDFLAIADILDIQQASLGLDPSRVAELSYLKAYIRQILAFVNTGEETMILKDDARRLYQFLAEKTISTNAFGSMLSKYELPTSQCNKPLGSSRTLATRPRCIRVKWSMTDLELLKSIREANKPVKPTAIHKKAINDTM